MVAKEDINKQKLEKTTTTNKHNETKSTNPITQEKQHANLYHLKNIKNDFYDTPNSIKWDLYVKSIDSNQASVEFTETNALIRFKTNDPGFLSQNNCSDPNTLFEWNVEFFDKVQAEKCKYTINKSKMEIELCKIPTKINKWATPIKRVNSKQDEQVAKKINIQPSPTSSSKWIPVPPSQPPPSIKLTNDNNNNRSRSRSPSSSLSPPPSQSKQKTCSKNITSSSNLNTSPKTNDQPITVKPTYYGFTGLVNLGNTCYMNAALQFLINAVDLRNYFIETPQLFQKEINTKNALGQNGQMAIQFAMLIRQLWTSKQSYIAPNKLKELICHKYTHFRGYEQQDTQEFLFSLLSLLHEDLNRVLKKPYYESSLECENDSFEKTVEIANESWKRFLSRENSIVVDNFYGQFKSKLTCPECHKVSITFEAFSNLIVPLPKPKKDVHFVLMYHYKRDEYPNELSIFLNENDTIEKLIDEIKLKFNHLKNSAFKVFMLYKNENEYDEDGESDSKFDTDWRMLSIDSNIPTLDNSKFLVICETETEHNESSNDPIIDFRVRQICKFPLNSQNMNQCSYCQKVNLSNEESSNQKTTKLPRCTKCYRSAYCDSECQRNDWQKHSKTLCSKPNDTVGLPFIISLKKSELINQETGLSSLRKSILDMCVKSVEYECASFKNNFIQIELINPNDSLNKSMINLNSNYDKLIEFLNQTNKSVSLELCAKWFNNTTDFRIKTNLTNIKNLTNDSFERKITNLNDCLKLFTIPEKLSSDNPWYCSNCKKHQEATKQMSLWHLPKYLIITMKRFQATKSFNDNSDDPRMKMMMMNSRFSYLLQNHVTYNKLNDLVEFPIRNLDMSQYLVSPNAEEKSKCIYDLCSVINHLGHSISVGHYTAYARTHSSNDTTKDELSWRLFDDQHVAFIKNDNQIVSKDAYVLMYRLRNIENSVSIQEQSKTEQKPNLVNINVNLKTESNILKIPRYGFNESEEPEDDEYFDIESEESEELNDNDGLHRNDENEDDEDDIDFRNRSNFRQDSHLNYTNLNEMD